MLQPRTPLKSSPALRLLMSYARKKRKCILCLSMICDSADQFETSTSPGAYPGHLTILGDRAAGNLANEDGIVPQSGEMKRPVKVSSFEPWVAGENKVRECFWRLTRGN